MHIPHFIHVIKEFDFDAIAVLGLKINLPKGKAAELGSATGLGSWLCERVCDSERVCVCV